MRLACIYCDTEEADGVEEPPDAWTEVCPALPSDSALAWYDHLGLCPACTEEQNA